MRQISRFPPLERAEIEAGGEFLETGAGRRRKIGLFPHGCALLRGEPGREGREACSKSRASWTGFYGMAHKKLKKSRQWLKNRDRSSFMAVRGRKISNRRLWQKFPKQSRVKPAAAGRDREPVALAQSRTERWRLLSLF